MALAVLGDRRYARFRTLDALALYEELIVTGAWWDFVDEVAAGPLGDAAAGGRPGAARVVGRRGHVEAPRVDHRPGPAQARDRLRAADRLHRAQPRGPRVLHPQGDRLGAARLRLGRARDRASPTATPTSCPRCRAARRSSTSHERSVITLRRMAAYLRAHGVDAWADYIEALPPDGRSGAGVRALPGRDRSPRPVPPPHRARAASCASNSRRSRRTSCR